jgi:glycosyltransferase involved in cell wall biosynthesis
MPLLNLRIAAGALAFFFTKLSLFVSIFCDLARHAEGWKVVIRNLIVLPKALYVSRMINGSNTAHIHAHWGSTTATMAYVLSRATGVPWSMTLHRGDIYANNLLKLKVQSASFVRCISEQGRRILFGILGGEDHSEKIRVIHMGVDLRHSFETRMELRSPYVILTPASLRPVKGHRYLIGAFSILIARGFRNFRAVFCGQGPSRSILQKYIRKQGLSNYVEMAGQVPHGELMKMYEERGVHLVVLPSIRTEAGEHEGVPVSLMEAMSYGVPVISTRTGAIPELLGDGSGVLCDEKNSQQLADAIQELLTNPDRYRRLAENGRLKVEKGFDVIACSRMVLALVERNCW